MASQPTSGGSAVRFEATVHARSAELPAVDSLDLDRVPDPEGGVRMSVDPQDLARLVAEGYEVGVQAVAPLAPLDPSLVSDEADARAYQQPVAGAASSRLRQPARSSASRVFTRAASMRNPSCPYGESITRSSDAPGIPAASSTCCSRG